MPMIKAIAFPTPLLSQLPGEAGGRDGGAASVGAEGPAGGEGAAEAAGPAADQRHSAA